VSYSSEQRVGMTAIGAVVSGGIAAIGASAAKSPATGAFVAVAAVNAALGALVFAASSSREGAVERLVLPIVFGTAVIGGGAALGASSTRNAPLGAAVGAAGAQILGNVTMHYLQSKPEQAGQISGAPRSAIASARVRAGAFP